MSSSMWPSRHSLGAQLTYGISGPAVPDASPTSGPSSPLPRPSILRYPRIQDQGPALHRIEYSTVQLASSETSKTSSCPTTPLASGSKFLADDFDVSGPLLEALEADARPFHDPDVVDPAVASLAATFVLGTGAYSDPIRIAGNKVYPKAKNNMIPVQCLAFAASSNTLRVVPMLPKRKHVFDGPGSKSKRKATISVPDACRYVAECKFPFAIRQIEPCHHSNLLGVRGSHELVFISVVWNNDPGEKGIELYKAFSIAHESPLLHFALNRNRFIVIDGSGSYTLYSFGRRGTYKLHKRASANLPCYDPSDISSWKRACWPLNANFFYYLTRRSVSLIFLDDPSQNQKLISFHRWSHLQDYSLIGDDSLFLLTSQELIWTRIADSCRLDRILSWKHYLDDNEVSTKLAVQQWQNAYICSVYSNKAPFCVVYTFGYHIMRPSSLRDPYIVRLTIPKVRFIKIFESPYSASDNESLLDFIEVGSDASVTLTSYCQSENRAFRRLDETSPEPDRLYIPNSQLSLAEKRRLYQHLLTSCMSGGDVLQSKQKAFQDSEPEASSHKGIQSSLGDHKSPILSVEATDGSHDMTQRIPEPSQVDLVQKYAFDLGSDIKQLLYSSEDPGDGTQCLPTHLTLADIAGSIPTAVTDLEEFDSMLKQLGDYYNEESIDLSYFDRRLAQQLGTAFGSIKQCNTKELYGALCKYEHGKERMASIILMASLTRAFKRSFMQDVIKKIREESVDLPRDIGTMFDEWEVHDAGVGALSQKTASGNLESSQLPSSVSGKKNQKLLRQALTQSQSVSTQPDTLSLNRDVGTTIAENPSQITDHSALASAQSVLSSQAPPAINTQASTQRASETRASAKVQTIKRLGSRVSSQKKKKAKGGFA